MRLLFRRGGFGAKPANTALSSPPKSGAEGAGVVGSADKSETMFPDDFIRVSDLIARYSVAEHAARADAYFDRMSESSELLRKPFFGISDTQSNMHGIAEILQRLKLFPGARVLDFGSGTGWFSRILAFLEADPIALDVSAKALALGQRAFVDDPLTKGLSIEWQVFDGLTLPLQDASVDRVLCYDSFHHVPDQAKVLSEFYRVLADGGRAVFHEPGPQHSRVPVSQLEMRNHDVIENDIVVDDIWRIAETLGFTRIELALTAPLSADVDIATYMRITQGTPSRMDLDKVITPIVAGSANLRIFSLLKGEEVSDSRHGPFQLSGEFEMTLTDTSTDTLTGQVRVRNTGAKSWRPSNKTG